MFKLTSNTTVLFNKFTALSTLLLSCRPLIYCKTKILKLSNSTTDHFNLLCNVITTWILQEEELMVRIENVCFLFQINQHNLVI